MSVYRHVLVGTDGSPSATEAVRHAARFAAAFEARLTVMTVFTGGVQQGLEGVADDLPEDLQWQVTGAGQAEETARAGARSARQLGADAHPRVERGQPAEAIIKALELGDFDLVVVGSRGLTSASRFVLGSVPNAVSHHAPCDVAIIQTT